ncbi:hypothetical protein E2C01_058179 [Portunus trituberculatus]|uniref:Uncharacterized protein n=2 Tax=Portunus trituberculatus TaxID=210409 RepID=A0A5B7H2A6_PORTR|nr:hypothetical protein [Portunus trituberculatus]
MFCSRPSGPAAHVAAAASCRRRHKPHALRASPHRAHRRPHAHGPAGWRERPGTQPSPAGEGEECLLPQVGAQVAPHGMVPSAAWQDRTGRRGALQSSTPGRGRALCCAEVLRTSNQTLRRGSARQVSAKQHNYFDRLYFYTSP